MSYGRLKYRIEIGVVAAPDPPIETVYWVFEDGENALLENEDNLITEDS